MVFDCRLMGPHFQLEALHWDTLFWLNWIQTKCTFKEDDIYRIENKISKHVLPRATALQIVFILAERKSDDVTFDLLIIFDHFSQLSRIIASKFQHLFLNCLLKHFDIDQNWITFSVWFSSLFQIARYFSTRQKCSKRNWVECWTGNQNALRNGTE